MNITGTLISYYFYCHRRMWLHANGIQFENNSEDVAIGILIEETSYQKRSDRFQQVNIGSIKIDFYDAKNKIIHEVKKSSKFHETHIWQVKYYLYVLENNWIKGVRGILEYPKERKTEEVLLSSIDIEQIKEMEVEIRKIIEGKTVPELIKKSRCKNCSYFDFCFISEV